MSRRRIRLALLAEDPHCSYCGWPLDERSATLDHVVPRVAGGTGHQHNLRLACKRCNRRKGGLTADQLRRWTDAVCAVAEMATA